jgi:hypothetical protein
MSRLEAPPFAAIALVLVVIAGCKSQARKDHEALGASMRSAIDVLCDSYMRVEGGGCVTVECHDKRDAGYGHAAVVASRGLVVVPTVADPKTEAELSTIRAARSESSTRMAPRTGTSGSTGTTSARPRTSRAAPRQETPCRSSERSSTPSTCSRPT